MIGRLRGQIAETAADRVLIDVQGVGYEVHCPSRLLAHLSVTPDEAVTLVIETVLREDLIRLYGFSDAREREWFRLLQSVQGVGARVALALLSVLSDKDLSVAVAQGDHTAFARAQGVGPKLAKRLATELKDKAPAPPLGLGSGRSTPTPGPASPSRDAVSALVNLGYGEADAARAVAAAEQELGETESARDLQSLIRAGLRELA